MSRTIQKSKKKRKLALSVMVNSFERRNAEMPLSVLVCLLVAPESE